MKSVYKCAVWSTDLFERIITDVRSHEKATVKSLDSNLLEISGYNQQNPLVRRLYKYSYTKDLADYRNKMRPEKICKHFEEMPVHLLPNCGSYKGIQNKLNWLSVIFDLPTRFWNQGSVIMSWQNGDANRFIVYYMNTLGWLREEGSNNQYWRLGMKLLKNNVFQVMAVDFVCRNWHQTKSPEEMRKLIQEVKKLVSERTVRIDFKRVYIPKDPRDPNGKQRPLGVPTEAWRVYLHMLNVLVVWFLTGKIENQHAYQPKKGVLTGWLQVWKLSHSRKHIFEFDLKGFFDNVKLNYNRIALMAKGVPEGIASYFEVLNQSIITLTKEDVLDETANRKIVFNSDGSLSQNLSERDHKVLRDWGVRLEPVDDLEDYDYLLGNKKHSIVIGDGYHLTECDHCGQAIFCKENYLTVKDLRRSSLLDYSSYTDAELEVAVARWVYKSKSSFPGVIETLHRLLAKEGYSPVKSTGIAQGASTSCGLSLLNLKELNERFKDNISMYADDGLIFPEDASENPNLTVKEAGIEQNLEKSSWVKRNGIWEKSLKYLGLEYVPAGVKDRSGKVHSEPILKGATRMGSVKEFTREHQLYCYLTMVYTALIDYVKEIQTLWKENQHWVDTPEVVLKDFLTVFPEYQEIWEKALSSKAKVTEYKDFVSTYLSKLKVSDWIEQNILGFENLSADDRISLLFKTRAGPSILARIYNNSWDLSNPGDSRLLPSIKSWCVQRYPQYLFDLHWIEWREIIRKKILLAEARMKEIESSINKVDLVSMSLVSGETYTGEIRRMKETTELVIEIQNLRNLELMTGIVARIDIKSIVKSCTFKYRNPEQDILNTILKEQAFSQGQIKFIWNYWKQLFALVKLTPQNASSLACEDLLNTLNVEGGELKSWSQPTMIKRSRLGRVSVYNRKVEKENFTKLVPQKKKLIERKLKQEIKKMFLEYNWKPLVQGKDPSGYTEKFMKAFVATMNS